MKNKGKARRPYSLTEDRRKLLFAAIETGTPPSMAAAIAGIPQTTFYNWLRNGKNGVSEEYTQFYEEVEAAKASIVFLLTSRVLEAINEGDGRLALDALKCYYPQHFGSKLTLETQGVKEEPIDLAASLVSQTLASKARSLTESGHEVIDVRAMEEDDSDPSSN